MTLLKRQTLQTILASYTAGLATAGLIAILVAATPDSEPATAASGAEQTSSPAAASPWPAVASSPSTSTAAVTTNAAAVPQHSAVPLTPEARDRITPLEAKLVADPTDLASRKQLAVVLLQSQQLMQAYQHASQILASVPDDPDGLYIHGVVRLAMGHAPRAIELLDRVLARYPAHALALQARAEAQRKIGDTTGAELTATKAREAARGNDSEVEQLLAAASNGTLFEMIRGSDPTPSVAADAGAEADTGGE